MPLLWRRLPALEILLLISAVSSAPFHEPDTKSVSLGLSSDLRLPFLPDVSIDGSVEDESWNGTVARGWEEKEYDGVQLNEQSSNAGLPRTREDLTQPGQETAKELDCWNGDCNSLESHATGANRRHLLDATNLTTTETSASFFTNTSVLAETTAPFTTGQSSAASTTETSETFVETSAPFSTSLFASSSTTVDTTLEPTTAPAVQTSETFFSTTPAPAVTSTTSAPASTITSAEATEITTTSVVATPTPTVSDNTTETFTTTMASFSTTGASTPLGVGLTTSSSFSRPMTTSSTTTTPVQTTSSSTTTSAPATTSSTPEPTVVTTTTSLAETTSSTTQAPSTTTLAPTTSTTTLAPTTSTTTLAPTTSTTTLAPTTSTTEALTTSSTTTPVPTTTTSSAEPTTTTPAPTTTSSVAPTTTAATGELVFMLLTTLLFDEDFNGNAAYMQANVATNIADEGGLTSSFSFVLTQTSGPTDLFSQTPALDRSGTLSFALDADQNGNTTWSVILVDDTDSSRQSSAQTLVITVAAVDDPPAFTIPGRIFFSEVMTTVFRDAALVVPSPANEGQALTGFTVTPGTKILGDCREEGADPAVDVDLFRDVVMFLNGTIRAFLPSVADGEQSFTLRLNEDGPEFDEQTIVLTRSCVPTGEFTNVVAVQPPGELGKLRMQWSWTDSRTFSNASAYTIELMLCDGPGGDCSAMINVNTTTFSGDRFCTGTRTKDCGPALFSDLRAGQYEIFLYAVNSGGRGTSTMVTRTIVGRPPSPIATLAHRTLLTVPDGSVTGLYLEWTQLPHYGDFLDPSSPEAVTFNGYNVTIASGSQVVLRSFADVRDTFHAYEVIWSDAGYSIPGLDLTGVRGQNISFVVRASNLEFAGDFSDRAEEDIISISSPVQNLVAEETDTGMSVSWSIPADTGHGDQDTEPLLEYVIQASPCPDFDVFSEQCQVIRVHVEPDDQAPSQGNPQGPPLTFEISETLLQAGVEYFIHVAPRNRLGISPYGAAIGENFRVLPTLLSPQTLPIFVVEYQGDQHVWTAGNMDPNGMIVVTVNGWEETVGATMSGWLTDRTSAEPFTPNSFSQSLDNTDPEVRQLSFAPPTLSACMPTQTVRCTTTVTMWPSDAGSLLRNYITFPLVYIQYPRVRVESLFPLGGGADGGTTIGLTLVEYTGVRTRSRAGLVSLSAGNMDTITVNFTCPDGSQTSVSMVTVSGSDLQDSLPTGQVAWDLELQSPPVPGGSPCMSDVEIVVDGEVLPLQSDLTFGFLGPRIDTVTPPSANIARGTGGVLLTINLKGIPTLDSSAGVQSVWIEAPSNERFSLNVTSVVFSGDNEVVVLATTPELFITLAGDFDLHVWIGSQNLTIEWEFLAPPQPVIMSSSVKISQDGADRITPWINPSGGAATIQATISGVDHELGWSFEDIDLYIGGDLLNLATSCVTPVVVDSQVTVQCDFDIPSGTLSGGMSGAITFDISQDGMTILSAATRTDSDAPYFVYAVNPNTPSVVSWSAKEGPDDGGTIVLVGLMGVVRSDLSTIDSTGDLVNSMGLDFNLITTSDSTEADTLGVLSLDQYDDEESDIYRKVFLETRVKDSIGLSSTNAERRYSRVVSTLRNAPGADGANPAVLVASAPDVSDLSTLTEADVRLLVNNLDVLGIGAFTFRPQPTAGATAEAISATGVLVGGASGGDRLVVRLSDFPIVSRITDVMVDFGGTMVDVLELRESTGEVTIITVEVPSVTTFGDFDVNIWSTRVPSNVATFQYTFVNDLLPTVVSFAPFSVYNDGGYDMEVVLEAFPSFVLAAEVELVLTPAGTTTGQRVSTGDLVLTRDQDGLTTIHYPSTAEAAHLGLVAVRISAAGKTATYTINYVAPPTGTLGFRSSLNRVSGLCDGESTYIEAKITNMRLVTDLTSVMVTVGSADPINRNSDATMQIISSMTTTTISFTVPRQDPGVNIPVEVNLQYLGPNGVQTPFVIDSLSFECVDPAAPGVEYVFPDYATVGDSAMVDVGIKSFPIVNSSEVNVTLGAGAVLQAATVVRSDAVLTILKLDFIPASTGDLQIYFSPISDPSLEVSTFVNVFDTAPRIVSFTPLQEFESGQTTMSIEVINVPVGSDYSVAEVQFGSEYTSPITSVQYRTAASGAARTTATLMLTLPTSDGPAQYTPTLVITGGPSLDFPGMFTFTTAPNERLTRLEPEWASISSPAQVRLYLENFPGADSPSQISVLFLWPSGVAVPAAALNLVQDDSLLEKTKVQNLQLDVVTPVNKNVLPGNVQIFVWNTMYNNAVASSSEFRFINTASPRVIRAESEFDVGLDTARVPMSSDTEVTITVENVPSGSDTGEFVAYLGPIGDSIEILFSTFSGSDDAETTALVDLAVPSSSDPQLLHGFLAFTSDDPVCTPTCCVTYTCDVDCAVPVACFSVDQYDDDTPVVSFDGDLRGPAAGGTSVRMSITNILPLPDNVLPAAYFGNPDDESTPLGRVIPTFSNDEQTELVLVTPAVDLQGASQLSVEVTVVHPLRTDQVITFWFTYVQSQTYLRTVTPLNGPAAGDRVVTMDVANFPYPVSNVIVMFEEEDGSSVTQAPSESTMILPSSNELASFVQFRTPSTTPGTKRVRVTPVPCTQPCLSVDFHFLQVDEMYPEIEQPKPVRGAIERTVFPLVSISKLPPVTPGDIAVDFISGDSTVSSPAINSVTPLGSTDIQVVSFMQPPGLQPGMYTVRITVSDPLSTNSWVLDLQYRMFSTAVTSIVDVAPHSVPTTTRIRRKEVELNPPVSLFVSQFDQSLTAAQVQVTVGKEVAEVIDINTDSTGFSRIDIVAPAFRSPGPKGIVLSILNTSPLQTMTSSVTYSPLDCRLRRYCRRRGMVPDLRELVRIPSNVCSDDYCTSQSNLKDLQIMSVTPTEGPIIGGTRVEIAFQNLPAASIEDITVTTGSRARKKIAQVVGLTFDEGSTLLTNSGTLTILTPSNNRARERRFRVRVNFEGVEVRARFDFEYLPLVEGQALIMNSAPSVLYSSADLNLYAELLNIGKLRRRRRQYTTSDVQFRLTDADGTEMSGSVDEITDSTKRRTIIGLNRAGPWPLGNVTFKAWSAEFGEDSAASVLISVIADPGPMVVSSYPVFAKVNMEQSVVFKVMHLPINISETDVTGSITLGNASDITVTEIEENHDEDCQERICSFFDMTVSVPALEASPGMATFDFTASFGGESYNFSTTLSFISASVELFQPKIQTTDEAGTSDITIYLSDFPTPGCGETASCVSAVGSNTIRVAFGNRGDGTIVSNSLQDVQGLLLLRVRAPTSTSGDIVSVGIGLFDANDVLISSVGSDVTFTYLDLPPDLAPVDATNAGGTLVTMTVYGWGSDAVAATSTDLLSVYFNGDSSSGTQGEVVALLAEGTKYAPNESPPRSSVQLVARTPAVSAVGRVPCTLSMSLNGGTVPLRSTTFMFEFYRQPEAIATPGKATPAGETTSFDEASTELRITNFPSFPTVLSTEDIRVTFALAPGIEAGVTSVERAGDDVVVTVTVPPAAGLSTGSSPITVTYLAPPAVPLGMSPTATFERETKVATAEFKYEIPTVSITARYCEECAPGFPCVVSGRCSGDGMAPMVNRAPLEGNGNLTLTLGNGPQFDVTQPPLISVKFNLRAGVTGELVPVFSGLVRAIYSDQFTSIIEASLPPVLAASVAEGEVEIHYFRFGPPTVVPFKIAFFTPGVALHCPDCQAARINGAPFTVAITHFPLSTDDPVLDQAFIAFGRDAQPAKAARIISSNQTLSIVEITPPSYTCTGCVFTDGSLTVSLAISLKQDSEIGAETDFTFWSAPRIIDARFDSTGTSVYVTFDQPTNMAGMGESRDCSLLLNEELLDLIGHSTQFCQWVTESYLRIALGVEATIVPDDVLTITATNGLTSENMISQPSTPSAVIGLPVNVLKPSLVLSGENSVDLCSDVEISGEAISVRAVTYFWSCTSCGLALETFLSSYKEATLIIPAGSDAIEEGEHQIVASVIDFMGVSSDPATFDLEIRTTPTPKAVFSPAATSVFADEPIQIKAQMAFSNCPVDKATITFAWTQVGAGADLANYLAGAGSTYVSTGSLYIPENTLTPGTTYQVQVEVMLEGDATKTATAVHTIEINKQGLHAVIAGGSGITSTASESLTLEASDSRDLDLPASDPQGLSFAWTCSQDGQPCIGVDGSSIGPLLGTFANVDTLVIPGNTLPPSGEDPYFFTVIVSKGSRISTTTMPATLLAPPLTGGPPPTVTVEVLEGEGRSLPSLRRDGSARVNSLDELVLFGDCSNAAGALQWSFDPPIDVAAAPSGALPFGTASSTFKINADVGLLDTGVDYTVTLSCTVGSQTGAGSMVLRVNNPPSSGEGPCRACVQGRGRRCRKVGVPTTGRRPTRFSMTCSKWSDTENDNRLQYRFGIIQGSLDLGWTEWRNERKYVKSLPTGVVTFKAQVRDSKGAVSDIMYDTVEVDTRFGSDEELSESEADNRRRLLATTLSTQWQNLISQQDGLTELLQRRSDSGVLDEVKTLALSHLSNNDPPLSQEQREEVVRQLYDAVDDIVQTSTLTNDYVTLGLESARAVISTRAAIVNVMPNSAILASKIVKDLTSSDLVTSITEADAQNAYDIAAVALSALQFNISCVGNVTGTLGESQIAKSVIGNYETSLNMISTKYAASLQSGEGTQSYNSFASKHQVLLSPFQDQLGVVKEISVLDIVTTEAAPVVDLLLPSNMATVLGITPVTDVTLDFSVFDHAPVVDQMTPISPLVSVALYNGNAEIDVSGLTTPVEVTVPLDTTSLCEADKARFTGYGKCMHWDTASQEYKSDGCTARQFIGTDRVTCLCDHLTSFMVVPDFDFVPPTTSTPPPPPPSTSAPPPTSPPPTTAPPPPPTVTPPTVTVNGEAPPTTQYSGWVGATLTPSNGARVVYTLDGSSPSCTPPFGEQSGDVNEVVNVLIKKSVKLVAISCHPAGIFSSQREQEFQVALAPWVKVDFVLQHPVEESLDDAEKDNFRKSIGRRVGLPEWALSRVEFVQDRLFQRRSTEWLSGRRTDVAVEHTYTVNASSLAAAETLAEQVRGIDFQATAANTDGWGNVQIQRKTVTVVDPNAPPIPTPPDDDDDGLPERSIALIIGLSVGGAVLCFAGLAGLYYYNGGKPRSGKQAQFTDVAQGKQPEPIAGTSGQYFSTSNDPLEVERRLMGGRPPALEQPVPDLYASTFSNQFHSQGPFVQQLRSPTDVPPPIQGGVGLVVRPQEARHTVTTTPFALRRQASAAESQSTLADYPASLYQSFPAQRYAPPASDPMLAFAPDPMEMRMSQAEPGLGIMDSQLVYASPPAWTMGENALPVPQPDIPELQDLTARSMYESAVFPHHEFPVYASQPMAPTVAPDYYASQPMAPTVAPDYYASQPMAPTVAPDYYASQPMAPTVAPDYYASQPMAPTVAPDYYASQPMAPTVAPDYYSSQPMAPLFAPESQGSYLPQGLQVMEMPPSVAPMYAPMEGASLYESAAPYAPYQELGLSADPPLLQFPEGPPPPLSVTPLQPPPSELYQPPWQQNMASPQQGYVPPWER